MRGLYMRSLTYLYYCYYSTATAYHRRSHRPMDNILAPAAPSSLAMSYNLLRPQSLNWRSSSYSPATLRSLQI